MVGFELARVELVGMGLMGWRREEWVLVLLVHQRQLEQRLWRAVEGSRLRQERELSEWPARRARVELMGQRWHSCWLR